jgi:DNA polymerase
LAYKVDEDENGCEEPEGIDEIEEIAGAIRSCSSCGLAQLRKNAVPGEGVSAPLVMVIGEGPGADEDAAGRPFVGKAGQLLDRMLASIGLYRDKNCFIANMVKCRPPGHRDPGPEEISACFPFLLRQIILLKPGAILTVGRIAAQSLLKTSVGINKLRGVFANFTFGENSTEPFAESKDSAPVVIPLLPTFHPSAVLRDPSLRAPVWEDLKLLKSHLDSIC